MRPLQCSSCRIAAAVAGWLRVWRVCARASEGGQEGVEWAAERGRGGGGGVGAKHGERGARPRACAFTTLVNVAFTHRIWGGG